MTEQKDYSIGGGYYFVATVIESNADLPRSISDDLQIARAKPEQIANIKGTLDKNPPQYPWVPMRRQAYEAVWKKVPAGGRQSQWLSELLAENEHRYFVVNFKGTNAEATRLFSVARLLHPSLQAFDGFLTSDAFGLGDPRGQIGSDLSSKLFYDSMENYLSQALTQEYLDQLVSHFQKYKQLDSSKHEGIIRAIDAYSNFMRNWGTGPLDVIGMFSVVEMLLTHKPNDKELGDSLNHQIRTKIELLNKRFPEQLDCSQFRTDSISKIWTALYAFRSAVAHGEHVDFSGKSLKVLESKDIAMSFLTDATKKLLRQAILEPDLVNALKPI